MDKSEQMYKWSGGTDYRHTCNECSNCIKVPMGSRKVDKCKAYGVNDSTETNWRASYIACRHFGKVPPEVPVIELFRKRKQMEIEGQMSLADFIE